MFSFAGTCPQCGSVLRPNIVFFSEMLPQDQLQKAIEAVRQCACL